MTFKNHVEEVLKAGIDKTIRQQGYILETEFCTKISKEHSLDLHIIRPVLRRIYPEMLLTKRRMLNDLKKFYGLAVSCVCTR